MMWIFIILTYLLAFLSTQVNSNQSFNNNNNVEHNLPTILLMPLQMIGNSSLNSSLMENQIQEQNSLSNTSLMDLQNDNNTQQLQRGFRERKRQERLQTIQTQILQRLGITGRVTNSSNVNSFSDEERNLMNRVVQVAPTPRTRINTVTGVNEISSSEIFAERLQSFYPSCSVPNHTDPIIWNLNSDSEMKLFYDITFPRSAESRTEVTAISAKLRIYKYNDPPREQIPTNNIVTDRLYRYISQEGLTISLYQYMRPLRYNRREKKRLIDSRTVAWNKRGFIEFNVINAINHWQNNPIRNFGLYVEIEDPYGVRHNPLLYLSQMNCSVQDTPMPNLAEIYPEVNNETSVIENENFPTLDLLTIEMVKEQQNVFNNNFNNVSSRRKRLAQRSTQYERDICRTTKTTISIKDLNLDDIILYPLSFEIASCKGFCHKQKRNYYECKASDYKDIKFVYLDENSNPRIKKVKGFAPQSCECVEINEI